MNISIASFSKKSTLKLKIMLTLLLILLSSIWFALQSQPVKHVTPDAVVMRRESLSLDQALNLSLACGDYRRVNVNWAEVA